MMKNRALTVVAARPKRRPRGRKAVLVHGRNCTQVDALIHRLLFDLDVSLVVLGVLAWEVVIAGRRAVLP
jgi:hypothetical protein